MQQLYEKVYTDIRKWLF